MEANAGIKGNEPNPPRGRESINAFAVSPGPRQREALREVVALPSI
ncbi:hypothetical protein LG3211_2971 [Lysobacter gummosus]|nr:hypothetical protein LG3211_2971 [Lysobacter gummosus]